MRRDRADEQSMHTTEMKMQRRIQSKTRKDTIKNEKRNNGQANHQICHPETHFVFLVIILRRNDKNVAKEITTMKVGGKRPLVRPILRWMDRVRSDMKEH